MHYDEVTQITTDFDWFAADSRGFVGHFASSGGRLPQSVAQSVEDHEKLVDFFESLPPRCEIRFQPDLARIADLKTESAWDQYVKSFARFGLRGLYSYDRTLLNVQMDLNYHLVCAPSSPLMVEDLPREIRYILQRTCFKSFGDQLHSADDLISGVS